MHILRWIKCCWFLSCFKLLFMMPPICLSLFFWFWCWTSKHLNPKLYSTNFRSDSNWSKLGSLWLGDSQMLVDQTRQKENGLSSHNGLFVFSLTTAWDVDLCCYVRKDGAHVGCHEVESAWFLKMFCKHMLWGDFIFNKKKIKIIFFLLFVHCAVWRAASCMRFFE